MSFPEKRRCAWVNLNNPHYQAYHDNEWGMPVHDDMKHFEMLTLEGAQAGLSWETILKRRDDYKLAFKQFDPVSVSKMTDDELELLLTHSNIIRNRLKVFSTRTNAQVFLGIQEEFGSFDHYVWGFVEYCPKINRPLTLRDVPSSTPKSDALSKDLKKRGMRFVGTTIIYAYMQAIGMVNDHTIDCFRCSI